MKTTRFLTVITVVAVIGFLMPAAASAHGWGHVGFSIGIGVPIYAGYGYWGGPAYYPYYPYAGAVYVAPPPVVVAPPVIVNSQPKPIAVVRQDAITSYVNVPNSNGSITPVRVRRLVNVWVGPKGEQYLSYPTVEQLKPIYGF